jgi:hypothetical protein
MIRVSGDENDCFYRACSLFLNIGTAKGHSDDLGVTRESLDTEAKLLRKRMRDFALANADKFARVIDKNEESWANFLQTTGCNNLAEAAERIVTPRAAADLFEIHVFANMVNVNVIVYNDVGHGKISFYQRVEPTFPALDRSKRRDMYLYYYMDSGSDAGSHYNLLRFK